jgi:quercetin 2,3-dioxygenase
VQHSEFNASDTEPVEFLQIWVLPEKTGLQPGYEQITLDNRPGWQIVAASTGNDGALTVHQDIQVQRGQFSTGGKTVLPLAEHRNGWLQVVRGAINLGSYSLVAGDAASLSQERNIDVVATTDAELLLFDLR